MNELNQIQKYYDRKAEENAQEWYSNDAILPNIKDFLSLLPKEPTILDLGCGTGPESKRLQSLGAKVTGIDISQESIRIARDRNPDISFIIGNFTTIDESIGQFDGVFAAASLIHIAQEEITRVLERIITILKRNGTLCIIIRDGHGKTVMYSIIDNKKYERTIYFYTREEVSQYCKSIGLEFIRESQIVESRAKFGWRCYLYEKK